MNSLPYWIKVVIRVILLPIAFTLHLTPHLYGLFSNMVLWVRYGGEFITYRKGDAATIRKIFDEIIRDSDGLTIRQHFAAMAMQGLLANYVANNDSVNDGWPYVAAKSVMCADELIKELNKPTDEKK